MKFTEVELKALIVTALLGAFLYSFFVYDCCYVIIYHITQHEKPPTKLPFHEALYFFIFFVIQLIGLLIAFMFTIINGCTFLGRLFSGEIKFEINFPPKKKEEK